MKDVAARAGVSVSTVSHVLNKTRTVAPQTVLRIREAIRELSYYRDLHARRLARGRSNFLGLIVSDIGNPFFPELVKSFETSALNQGFDFLLCNTNYDPARTAGGVRKMIENKVSGVAVMTSEVSPDLLEQLTSRHMPVVFLDLGAARRFVANIRVDYSRGIHEAIDHLFGLGHRNFAFIAGPQNLRSAVIRREAFTLALREHGLPADCTAEGNHQVEGGAAAAKALLASRPMPTAILCSNDLTAIGAIRELSAGGFSIPGEVSLVGFDDIDFACLTHPSLTTVNLPRGDIGKLAFEALHKILRSKSNRGAEYVVETHLVVRQSTGPVREGLVAFQG